MPTQQTNQPLALSIAKPIVLVGLMGAGKTTVGRRLAARLHLPFTDADDEIEKAAGLSIAEMFSRYGEPAFRDGERRVIQRLMAGPTQVIATGGGAFVDPVTRALILAHAIAIWLQADIDLLVERTARRDTRPLLASGDPRTILTELLAVRTPAYEQAPIHVRSDRGPHELSVETIIAALKDMT
jgi:shikimate kinase